MEWEIGAVSRFSMRSLSPILLHSLWEQMLRSNKEAIRREGAGVQTVKRFKWLNLTQLNASSSLFLVDPTFSLPLIFFPPYSISTSSSWMCCSPKCQSQRHGFCRPWKATIIQVCSIMKVVEHHDTAPHAASPSGGLIWVAPSWNVIAAQLAGICACLQCEDIDWHICAYQAVLWRSYKWPRTLLRFTELRQGCVLWSGDHVLWSVPLRWVGLLLSFSEAKNSPVVSPFQWEDVCLCVHLWLYLWSCQVVSVTV